MAHLVLCFVYFIWIVFIRIYTHYFSLDSPRFRCACFCYFFFCPSFFLFHFPFLSMFTVCLLLCSASWKLAIWCCFMLNNVRICIIWYRKHVEHTTAKILGKIKREKNLPLTTCIYLSQIRCVSFIVYHTHIWSFHSILCCLFACLLALALSLSLSLFVFVCLQVWLSAFIVLRATSFALIPSCNPRVATVIFSYTMPAIDTHAHKHAEWR